MDDNKDENLETQQSADGDEATKSPEPSANAADGDTEAPASKPGSASTKPPSAAKSKSGSAKNAGTSKPGSAQTASKAGSKPGSAKSVAGSARSGSAKSLAGNTGLGSAKSSAKGSRRESAAKSPSAKGSRRESTGQSPSAKGKKLGKKRDSEETTAVAGLPGSLENEDDFVLPEGAIPIFLASKTQEIFQCTADEDVTKDRPYKLITKEAILQDVFNRAAVSDFQPFKQIIQDYTGVELLLGYDADFKFGQNFYMAITEDAKEKILHREAAADEEGEEGVEGGRVSGAVSQNDVVYRYVPPEPKEWVSLGSEKEIQEESLVEHRSRINITVQRKRRIFGAPVEFSDRDASQGKDSYIECPAFEDKTFDMKRIELDLGVQAIPEFQDSAAQTEWKFPRNAACQYEPREFTEEQQKEIQESNLLAQFINGVAPRFELALQQNEIMDIFYDDWANLADDDSSFGSKADNHLKEYQSFTDLQFSKDKTITAIEWHPTVRGVVAVSVAERFSHDERIEHSARIIMTPSLILIWSFADPIHPQLLLEAPDDILCFKFCPTDPNIIVGGCMNGQIVLWDISQQAERLKQPRGKRKDSANVLPGFEDESAMDIPIIRYCAVSSIDQSHQAAVTDVHWLPDHLEVNKTGVPLENKTLQCTQIMSCATDHLVLFWDTKPPKHRDDKKDIKNPMGVPDTFKHIDLVWKPMLKVNLFKSEPGGDHSPTKFSISETQGDRTALAATDDDIKKTDSSQTMGGGFNFGPVKPGAEARRPLPAVKTKFFVGTEDGEIVYVDWMPQKDQDSGKSQTPKPDYYHSMHDGPVVTLQRSPFFRDIVLCVGGWSFTIWKEGVSSGPILQSAASSKRFTAGHWSPSRPAVFYITKQDGSVDIWDLLDRTHEPSMNQSVSPMPITTIFPFPITNKQHLLAVGDNSGTLHILEIPWSLRQPAVGELAGVGNYFDREVRRRTFVVARWDFREKEKMEIEMEKKNKAGIAPKVVLTEEEMEVRMKMEYQAYLDEESIFLRELGLKEEEPEPLPSTD